MIPGIEITEMIVFVIVWHILEFILIKFIWNMIKGIASKFMERLNEST